jgi:hypothetical protein
MSAMEPQRRNLLAMAAAGCLLILAGIFSGSWISGSGGEGNDTEMKIGLAKGIRCVSGQCAAQSPGSFDDNLGYVGIFVIVAGLVSLGATVVAMVWIFQRQEAKIDPKKLALPVGVGGAAAAAFLFIGHQSAKLTPSWSAVVAILGFGAAAGAMFLSKMWLPNGAVGYAPPPQWGQQPQQQPPPWNTLPPQGYAPPQQAQQPQQPQQQGGYAPPQRPVQAGYGGGGQVQPIQPTMPAQPSQPYGQPQGGYAPPSQPPTPMTPQPFVPARPAQGSQPPVAMMSNTIPPGANPCPKCSTGLAYSSQYGKWYCARCREYM